MKSLNKGGLLKPRRHPHLDKVLVDSFREVQPPKFRDHPDSSIDAANADMDVEDTIGGE